MYNINNIKGGENMNVLISIGDQIEQMNINQVIDSKSIPGVMNKLVNPTLVFRSQFIPGSIDIAVIVSTQGIDTFVNHDTNVMIRKKGKQDILATTTNIQLPANLFKQGEGINLNCEFKKVIVREEGEYEVVFTVDGQDFPQCFFVNGIEILPLG